ncbi:MAG: hypothetical protein Q7W13_16355 [Bacteroidia bacterium]|nr:hypothetical protein [Bacteroidia bacterium]
MERNFEINIEQIISEDFVEFNEGNFPYCSNLQQSLYIIIMNLSFERKLGERLEDVLESTGIKTQKSKKAIPLLNGNLLQELKNHSYIPAVNMGYVYSLFPDITLMPKDKDYPLFFSLKLNQLALDDIDDYLSYHLKTTFNDDFKKFKRFLELRFRGEKDIISTLNIETAQEWIKNESGEIENKIIEKTSQTKGTVKPKTKERYKKYFREYQELTKQGKLHNQILKDLSTKYSVSIKTIERAINS